MDLDPFEVFHFIAFRRVEYGERAFRIRAALQFVFPHRTAQRCNGKARLAFASASSGTCARACFASACVAAVRRPLEGEPWVLSNSPFSGRQLRLVITYHAHSRAGKSKRGFDRVFRIDESPSLCRQSFVAFENIFSRYLIRVDVKTFWCRIRRCPRGEESPRSLPTYLPLPADVWSEKASRGKKPLAHVMAAMHPIEGATKIDDIHCIARFNTYIGDWPPVPTWQHAAFVRFIRYSGFRVRVGVSFLSTNIDMEEYFETVILMQFLKSPRPIAFRMLRMYSHFWGEVNAPCRCNGVLLALPCCRAKEWVCRPLSDLIVESTHI